MRMQDMSMPEAGGHCTTCSGLFKLVVCWSGLSVTDSPHVVQCDSPQSSHKLSHLPAPVNATGPDCHHPSLMSHVIYVCRQAAALTVTRPAHTAAYRHPLPQAGYFDDALPGAAHFLEHMVHLGSEAYPDDKEYKAFLAAHGGSSNASTGIYICMQGGLSQLAGQLGTADLCHKYVAPSLPVGPMHGAMQHGVLHLHTGCSSHSVGTPVQVALQQVVVCSEQCASLLSALPTFEVAYGPCSCSSNMASFLLYHAVTHAWLCWPPACTTQQAWCTRATTSRSMVMPCRGPCHG